MLAHSAQKVGRRLPALPNRLRDHCAYNCHTQHRTVLIIFPHPLDNHHSSDDVYRTGKGKWQIQGFVGFGRTPLLHPIAVQNCLSEYVIIV